MLSRKREMYSMKLNFLTEQIKPIGRWITTAIFCLSAMTFIWQGGFFHHHGTAIAAPSSVYLVATDVGKDVKDKAREDAGSAKGFIRDAANQVERTANKNANKVEDATDGSGNFLERKAKKDAATIQKRAEQDAARTQDAVDDTKNVIERTVDNIKDTFNN